MSFRWSPDGERIAVMAGNSDAWSGAGETIKVIDVRNGNVIVIESNSRFNSLPVWTSDGNYLVYTSGSEELLHPADPFPVGYGINLVRADGTCFTRLTEGSADDDDPRLSR
jgi:Tol biopolymer transport system component